MKVNGNIDNEKVFKKKRKYANKLATDDDGLKIKLKNVCKKKSFFGNSAQSSL